MNETVYDILILGDELFDEIPAFSDVHEAFPQR